MIVWSLVCVREVTEVSIINNVLRSIKQIDKFKMSGGGGVEGVEGRKAISHPSWICHCSEM